MPQTSAFTWPGLILVVLGSSFLGNLLTKVFDRSSARSAEIRASYADAIKALNNWGQYPTRIRRRTDDEPETLRKLEELGAQGNSALAYSVGWVSGENPAVGQIFNELTVMLRAEVARHARLAWATVPANSADLMNLAGPIKPGDRHFGPDDPWAGIIPAEWMVIQLFSQVIRYRFGWRRLLPSWYLRRRFQRMKIIAAAREAFEVKSIRRLYVPDDGHLTDQTEMPG
ncbi:hypothetical protein ACQP2F_12485 [Actinoplanes sp. CA-030573]|uniref:hypothetical protein n=1 Tax=Actinoplanes sp. CA-030573 TaxID=3239898 RepID=UPI003D89B5E6